MALGSCAVKNCNNKGSYEYNVNFFRIPKDVARAVKWLRHCREGTSLRHGRICSEHFKKSDYKSTDKARPYLRDDAVPTVNIIDDDDQNLDQAEYTPHSDADANQTYETDPVRLISHSKRDINKEETTESQLSLRLLANTFRKKLKNVLCNTDYCGICLEMDNGASSLHSVVTVITEHQETECTLIAIVQSAFGDQMLECLANNYLCTKCTNTCINAYILVCNATFVVSKLNHYVDDLLLQVDSSLGKVDECHDITNVVLTAFGSNYKLENDNRDMDFKEEMTVDTAIERSDDAVIFICDYCQKVHFSEAALLAHLEVVHSEKDTSSKDKSTYFCPDCSITNCVHEKYLEWFSKQKRAGRKLYKCLECSHFSENKFVFIEHVNRKHLSYSLSCGECERKLYSKRSLRVHVRKYHKERLVCELCDGEFKDGSALRDHTGVCSLTIRPYGCSLCPATFDEADYVVAHERKRHTKWHKDIAHGNKINDITFRGCTVCHRIFDSYKELLRHMRTHPKTSLHKCKYCNEQFKSMKFCHNHERVHKKDDCPTCAKVSHECLCTKELQRSFLCDTCGKNYSSKGALNTHLKDHLDLTPCSICNKSLKASSMKSHMWRHKGALRDPNFLDKQRRNKRKYKCDSCNYITTSAKYMESHINRYHLKIKPYKCDVCGKEFAGPHLRDIHMEVHNKTASYRCKMCDKRFGRPLGLKLHIRSAHTGEKPFYCEMCGDSFISSSLLSRHQRKLHLQCSVQCPICGSKLASVCETRKHIKRMHWNGVGTFDLKYVEELTDADREMLEDRRRSCLYSRGQPI